MGKTYTTNRSLTAEHRRLQEARQGNAPWKRWGPYLSERAWGTVREDYSHDGTAWDYLPHDHARSRAYRWGEDGVAGICDDQQILCFAPAFWNTRDPILKERLFGLGGPEGNHGEDVKEVYYYLDSTPTYSYMKFLYKYPQTEFPYAKLAHRAAAAEAGDPEYELADTGTFDQSRYFDLIVEYAKADPQTMLIRITATNMAAQSAPLHIIAQLWFRNTWCWGPRRAKPPVIKALTTAGSDIAAVAEHDQLGKMFIYAEASARPLFTNNETNATRLWNAPLDTNRYVKDAFHAFIIDGRTEAVNREATGTKVGLQHIVEIDGHQKQQVRLVLTDQKQLSPFDQFDAIFDQRIGEADVFYDEIHHAELSEDERTVQRQALAGMLWSQQYYQLDMKAWLSGDDPNHPPPTQRLQGRNCDWGELAVANVISMPDKWEYPWFAAWDWAFHAISLAMVDINLAKGQLELLLSEKLQHPNGQIPAYEWAFSDVNPPVQAWGIWRVYNMEKHAAGGKGDTRFLERCYHKLLLNFTWWVNRKDSHGRNIFQGGFLGLDNISVFDRSQPMPGGGHIEQADATGWMGLYCLNMMSIGLELAQQDQVYEHLGVKFFEHFMHIAAAINGEIEQGLSLWNDTDGWYYDALHGTDGANGRSIQLAVRSQVGLIPLFAAMVLDHNWFEHLPAFRNRYEWLLTNRTELSGGLSCVWTPDGARCLLSIVNFDRLKRILARILDEDEFFSRYGVRALSRYHQKHPYTLSIAHRQWTVQYEPGESTTSLFGGNSNWRGPIWLPTNFMLITALRVYDRFFGEQFKVECPTGSGRMMTLNQVALEIGRRLCALLLRDEDGQRPIYNNQPLSRRDPAFGDHPLFYEYFHGDTGAGLGASHQTGWTGLVAKLLDQQAVGRDHGVI